MLIEFRVGNFRSFSETQTLSLVASKDEKHPDNLIPSGNFNLLKAVAIYGANASGKSNLIRAMGLMCNLVQHSATKMNQGDKIAGMVPFRLAPESSKQPCSFETTVIVDGTRFVYGFSATPERVRDEWLTAYPKMRAQKWLERAFNPQTQETTWSFRGPLESQGELLREKTRDNGLVLSRGAELNIKALTPLFLWFRQRACVFDLSVMPVPLWFHTARRIKEDPEILRRVTAMVHDADLGISALETTEESPSLEDMPKNVRGFLGSFPPGTLTSILVKTAHRIAGSEVSEEFDLGEDESNGTQRLFALAGPFLDALNEGTVVVVDELECSMHPLLVRKLIELFQSPSTNDKGAQLVFATHDSTLMDPELFRRDQIWLVEKTQKGASELFSLYDFDTKDRPRNTEAFQKNYLAGRYGGVPKFGPLFEDYQLK